MIARADSGARDLFARLIDEPDLETTPIEEVRADLALLGVDARRAIRLSRQLAEQAASPAAGLLAKSLAAEDSDHEIAKLESVDLRAIHAELSAASPLAAAYAERLANAAATGRPRRWPSRRFWYGVGGAVTAIAASVLIFIAVSPPELIPQQMAYAPPETSTELMRRPEQQTAASGSSAPAASSPAMPSAADKTTPAAIVATGGDANQPSSGEAEGKAAGAGSNDAVLAEGGVSFQGGATVTRSRSAAADGAEDLRVVAALILQPDLAPEPLRRANLTAGDLASRLAEAARLPQHRSIVALVTLARADGTSFDAMLLGGDPFLDFANSAGGTEESGEIAAPSGAVSSAITLRQLLDSNAEPFHIIEMKPATAAKQN